MHPNNALRRASLFLRNGRNRMRCLQFLQRTEKGSGLRRSPLIVWSLERDFMHHISHLQV